VVSIHKRWLQLPRGGGPGAQGGNGVPLRGVRVEGTQTRPPAHPPLHPYHPTHHSQAAAPCRPRTPRCSIIPRLHTRIQSPPCIQASTGYPTPASSCCTLVPPPV
jgi:hypothetical protein